MNKLYQMFILVILISSTEITVQNIIVSESTTYPYSFSYLDSLPIIITNDSNFTDYGLLGTGTPQEPFRIENLNITTSEDKGIYIHNTTKYFKIQNCFVDAYRGGIVIDSVRKETTIIEDNICVGNSATGIRILHSPGTKIINNTCNYNSFAGIHVGNSSESQIENNRCIQDGWLGIFVDLSEACLINNNTCNSNSMGGIVVEESPLSYVADNRCYENTYHGGISLSQSNKSTVVNNLCTDNSQTNIALYESNDSFVSNNHCSGMGIVIVNGGNVTVDNNICFGNGIGIYLIDAEESKITNNALYRSGFEFYELNREDYHSYIVQNNSVNDKEFGYFVGLDDLKITQPIYGQLILADCSNIQILNQNLSYTHTGITLRYCIKGTIQNNFCSDNWNLGIYTYGSIGMAIINNTCNSNFAGIVLESSSKNELSYNFLSENLLWGVVLDLYSRNNSIHHNSFIENNQYFNTAQAKDDGQNNVWYDEESEEGNYWTDYFVVVGSYYIDGFANAQDLYPLSEPPIYRNNNIYYSFLSLVVLIPLAVFGYFKFSSKRKSKI